MDMMEYQIGPKAVRERVNNTRDGKTKLQALEYLLVRAYKSGT
jgi:hypothetical protein